MDEVKQERLGNRMPATARELKERLAEIKQQIRRNKMARAVDRDDLDEVEPDNDDETVEETPDTEETTARRGRGRPKGSISKASNPTANFHAITMTKRGVPKHIIVAHVMGKNVRAVSAKNTNMDPVRLPVGNVYYYDEEIFEQLVARSEKIAALTDQNFGLLKQLKPVNAPRRVAKIIDPVEEL